MTELPPGADRPPWRAGACARTPADGAAGGARACARDQPTDTRWTPLPTGLLDALFTRGGVASPHRSKPKRETHVGRTDRGGNGEAPRGRSGQLSRCFVLQRLPEFPPSERRCRRLRVQRRRGWELEEQGLGVEVGASLTMNVDACRLTAILGGATTVIRARLWPGACLGLRAGAPVCFLHSRDFLIARSAVRAHSNLAGFLLPPLHRKEEARCHSFPGTGSVCCGAGAICSTSCSGSPSAGRSSRRGRCSSPPSTRCPPTG